MGSLPSRDAYHLDQFHRFLSSSTFEPRRWKVLWRSKIELLLRKLIWNALLINEVISSRIHLLDSLCMMCHQHPETAEHLLLHCSFSRTTWSYLRWPIRLQQIQHSSAQWVKLMLGIDNSLNILGEIKHGFLSQAMIFVDHLWQLHNNN